MLWASRAKSSRAPIAMELSATMHRAASVLESRQVQGDQQTQKTDKSHAGSDRSEREHSLARQPTLLYNCIGCPLSGVAAGELT
jgi:hypothetical protein